MSRPIETLLSFPRVRLIDRVPILETEEFVRRFMNRVNYCSKIIKHSLSVSQGSAEQFSADDEGLSALLKEVNSSEYLVTKRSRMTMESMLRDICGDGLIFKRFKGDIEPFFEASHRLREVSMLADSLADRTKEESLDVARALMIHLPKIDRLQRHKRPNETQLLGPNL